MSSLVCKNVRLFLHAVLDGELDLTKELEVREHLETCQRCSDEFQDLQALRVSVKNASLYYDLPQGLKQKVLDFQGKPKSQIFYRFFAIPKWGMLSASAVFLFVAWWVFSSHFTATIQEEQVSQEVVSEHIRSLLGNHLVDVASTDQHTVKPWFNGKLDFSPPVKDFSSEGFPLVGGRLEYLHRKEVAALVYKRQKHIINVFLWPDLHATKQSIKTSEDHGYHIFHWNNSKMTYWIVSDLNSQELAKFLQLVQNSP